MKGAVAILILLLVAVAGCGSDGASRNNSPTESTPSSTVTNPDAGTDVEDASDPDGLEAALAAGGLSCSGQIEGVSGGFSARPYQDPDTGDSFLLKASCLGKVAGFNPSVDGLVDLEIFVASTDSMIEGMFVDVECEGRDSFPIARGTDALGHGWSAFVDDFVSGGEPGDVVSDRTVSGLDQPVRVLALALGGTYQDLC